MWGVLGSIPPFVNFMHVRAYLPGLKKIRKVDFWSLWLPGLKKIEKLDFWSFEYLDSWIVATKQSLDSMEWISLNKTNLDNDSWVKTKSHNNVISGEGIVAKMWHDNSMKNHGKTWQFSLQKWSRYPFQNKYYIDSLSMLHSKGIKTHYIL